VSIDPQIASSPAPVSSHGRKWGRGVSAVLGFVATVFLTFLGLLAITFFIGRVIPIDPVLSVVGDRATPAVYEAAKVQMGLDQPLPVQFFNYVIGVFSGDLGKSVSTGRAVVDDLSRFFPATLEMATVGIIIGVALGVPLGVIAASRQGSIVDQVIRVVGLLGYSMPAFWLGLVGLALFYARLRWVGGPGRLDIF
jgi:peptide/nickel transport system permease protein